MWEKIDPAVLAVLPKQPLNGVSVNGTHSSGHEWSDALLTLERFRKEYTEHDWDGQGAPAISHELLDGAEALARALQNRGVVAPTYTLPNMQAGMGFEWDLTGGESVTVELIEPGLAEVFVFAPDKPATQYRISKAVTA